MSENIRLKKVAIVIFNLGGPDSKAAVKPFLFNLFYDKYIITLPAFFRYIIAWIISSRREKFAQKIYSHTGNKSPILQETIAQRNALTLLLKDKADFDFEIFISMRHWHPMSDEVAGKVKEYSPDEVILLPLYPQFSTTTTLSSIEDFKRALSKVAIKLPIKTIGCYPEDEKFIESHVRLIENSIDGRSNYRILFSAHGLPEKIIKSGDPYQWQVEKTVKNIVDKLNIDNLDYKITYQSRVGPMKWIGPNTEDEIKLACKEKKSLIVVPVAFVSEHVETLVELDIEYKHIADEAGIDYIRVKALGIDDIFIESLADLVIKFTSFSGSITTSSEMKKICPDEFSYCKCTNLK
jgi:ferrochelatase